MKFSSNLGLGLSLMYLINFHTTPMTKGEKTIIIIKLVVSRYWVVADVSWLDSSPASSL
jgi:hypothetical protein